MVATKTSPCAFGWRAPAFVLNDSKGRPHSLDDVRGERGTLVMFICNHCPYVRAVADRIARDTRELQAKGIGVCAIMANDWENYPEDAPEKMEVFAKTHGFTFPYLVDESQQVARAYQAVCTPEFFGFNADLELQYHGRLDESGKSAAPGARRDLFEAMCQIAETGKGPEEQQVSIGCSIKWRHQ